MITRERRPTINYKQPVGFDYQTSIEIPSLFNSDINKRFLPKNIPFIEIPIKPIC